MGRRVVTIAPFWNRMPRFFLYPLMTPAIYALFGLAVINGALLDLARGGGGGVVTAGVVSLVAALFSIKYGFHILEETAHGRLEPPRLNRATMVEGYELPFKQIGVTLVLMILGVGLTFVWLPLVIVYGIAVVALMPAIVVTLALERSMAAALTPAKLFAIAFRIGWPYFAVLGLVILLNGGSATVMSLFGDALPRAAEAFLGAFTQNYFLFAIMHLMGYLIFQYHDRVGFAPETLAEQDDGWGEILDPVRHDIDAGHYAAAADRLNGLIREYPDHRIELRKQRHQVLRLGDDERTLVQNAGTLLGDLVDANRMREAAEVYIDITDIDPELRPARETDYEPLLQILVQRGEYRRAVRMANGFHKTYPKSQSIPPLYLEVARVFAEFLEQPERAAQIATFLDKRYPDHPASARARALREALMS